MPDQSYIRKFLASGTRQALLILSLLVTLAVFWSLKLTGITMAGEAFCGMDEHTHDDTCHNILREGVDVVALHCREQLRTKIN